jgi:RNA polymerase sigma-70 factor (ECF subfamily)
LRLLAARLAPEDGAMVLLHEVFEAGHIEIAQASGKSEAGSRQQLRRALARLRLSDGKPALRPHSELDPGEEAVFHLYLQSLQRRDPQSLWAMLREPPVSASASMKTVAAEASPVSQATTSTIVRVGGQLGLALSLDGVTLCVVPMGVLPDNARETAPLNT